jgi:hypothetical protein
LWQLKAIFPQDNMILVHDATHRNIRDVLFVMVKNGTSDLLNVQYQVANVAARIISPMAEIKNSIQNIPKVL